MTCDYCGKSLIPADKPQHAPHGLPLFVCSKCYEQLKKSKVVNTKEETNDTRMVSDVLSECGS